MEQFKMICTKEDADCIQQIWDECPDPDFTVTYRQDFDSGQAQVEIYIKGAMELWYLAKRVQLENYHRKELQLIQQRKSQ